MVRFSFLHATLFVILSAGINGQYENCTGELDAINDGRCDTLNNNGNCGYDGGDCCECSCTNDRRYPCGIWNFYCSDPDVVSSADSCHQETLSSSRLCAEDTPQTWIVDDTTSATSVAEAIDCSGGTFNVVWRGSVLIDKMIYISNGTTLYVTGEGSGAEINGGGKTRLFAVVDAFLHVEGLTLTGGNATYGGAIAATRSGVYLNQTLSKGNIASSYGGAINIGINSTLDWEGKTMFTGNHAGRGGGAVAVGVNSTASWSGTTIFSFNSAGNDGGMGGALYVKLYSRIEWNGVASFVDNKAEDDGGALFAARHSFVSWDGMASFVNNTAAMNGGALRAAYTSTIAWNGNTSFVNNTATLSGGALYVYSDSNVSWDEVAYFADNKAEADGGALFAGEHSFVSWDGIASFVDNTATMNGGALCAAYTSTIAWNGNTSFVNNNAALYGGALYVFLSSNVLWNGMTSLIGNSAAINGGAVYVSEESSLSWAEETSFTGNNAISNGGAIYVTISSNISVGGETNFLNNEATLDGGAVFFYAGNDEADSSYFIMDTDPVVVFHENTCGGNGGAIALMGNVITRSTANVTFLGNTAGLAGGAIYISDVSFGMRMEGVKFISNSALIGGGLYSTGSGNDATNSELGSLEYNPTTLIGCLFIRNEAIKTGGAMDSRAGRDDIVNTSFVGNTAPLGGALKVDGTTSLTGCEFIENISGEDAGPGVFNDGVISRLSNCSFVDNALDCKTGFFLGNDETGALFETVCKGCDTEGKGPVCDSGCIVEGKEPICNEELRHSSSAGGNTTLESLVIESGYWRATNTSMFILACYNSKACLGGLTGTQDYCREGYKGPYCSVCAKGYTPSLGFTCNKCFDRAAGGIAIAVVVSSIFLFLFGAFLSYLLSPRKEAVDQGILGRVIHFLPLQSLKIVIVVWQILTQFASVANVVYPSVYQTFLDAVNIINFELSWIFSAKCIFNIDFHDQLLLSTLGPLVCMTILGATFIAAMRRSRGSEEARRIVRRKHVSMVLLVTFLVYSSVSSTLFKTFACDHLDDGKSYLRADYRIECASSKHKALGIYAGFMVFLYVVGIPAFYGFLLYNNRKALIKNTGREDDESVKFTADLWKPYRPERFYYEVIECARRVLLTGALVFIYPNSAAQIAAGLMMTTFFIFVSEALAPYESRWDTWCSRTGHAIVYMSIFLALLLKVDLSEERASSQRVFELVLIVAHSCLVLIVVVEAVAMVVAWKKQVKEDTKPRIRPSLRFSSPHVGRCTVVLEDDASPPSYEDVVSSM